MRQVLAEVDAFDKLLFLSAQDYPLMANRRLKQELAALAGYELLDCVPIGAHGWRCAERYRYFHRDGGGPLAMQACRLANRAMRIAGVARRMVNGWQPWGGSSWWTLSRECVEAIVGKVHADPAIVRFFRSVSCPDELFFQTLVMNSPFRVRVLSNNFRHLQWQAGGARNPKLLDDGDFDAICVSGAHFCRKVDTTVSAALLRRLRDSLERPCASPS
jgi:hypothetical protein